MNILTDLLTTDCISVYSPARNKAEVFTTAGDLFEKRLGISSNTVVEVLNAREDRSSTALSSGVAIPHGIVTTLKKPAAALIKLARPIDFAAPDQNKISILIFLLFPEIAIPEHLQILSFTAQLLLDYDIRENLLLEQDPQKIFELLTFSNDFDDTHQIAESRHLLQSIEASKYNIQSYIDEWAMLEVSRR